MGILPHRELAEQIWNLLQNVQGVRQLEEVQAHRFGPHIIVNLTIGIDGDMTVSEGHSIACRVENALSREIPNVSRVHVHYHPAEKQCENMTLDEILEEPR
jgi:divalent metal cation (Fe/Co/Zn/Cd) transporter